MLHLCGILEDENLFRSDGNRKYSNYFRREGFEYAAEDRGYPSSAYTLLGGTETEEELIETHGLTAKPSNLVIIFLAMRLEREEVALMRELK